jgi:SET and MYND domain-containing protein|tara:strand:+ start:224 stop:1693 length:1470 start_codon:yes stop_codon:yes gene_type:complete
MSASAEDLQRFHVKLTETPTRGRILVATKDLRPGHLVIANQPFARTLRPSLWDARCFYCFETLKEQGIQSNSIWYCSKRCQQIDYLLNHQVEGPLLVPLRAECTSDDVLSDMILVARTLRRSHSVDSAQAATFEMLNQSHQNATHIDGTKASVPIVSTTQDVEALVYHEPANVEESPVTKVANDVVASGLLGSANVSVNEIVRTLLRFGCNNFAVTSNLLVTIGAAVCPAGAILNHACLPNTAVTWNSNTGAQELRCCRAVQKGEELTHSYTDAAVPTLARRQSLRDNYGFMCECVRCSTTTLLQLAPAFRMELKLAAMAHEAALNQTNGQDEEAKTHLATLVATVTDRCGQPEYQWNLDDCMCGDLLGRPIAPMAEQGKEGSNNQNKTDVVYATRARDLMQASALMQSSVVAKETKDQYNVLNQVDQIYAKWLHPLHLDRLTLANEMLSVALALGDYKNAVKHVRRAVVVYDHVYGTTYYHPMVGLQR